MFKIIVRVAAIIFTCPEYHPNLDKGHSFIELLIELFNSRSQSVKDSTSVKTFKADYWLTIRK